ncbi:MAG: ATP-binding protein [Crocinitomicaceae bacterium]|nr:ATP-binding protein [Crocinitomicaceae bacterium]
MNEQQIRNQLTKLLNEEPENYSKILELTSLLASFDKDHVRFSVDAGVVDRLGRELVGKKETAVSELVKNAYDADSKTVDLIFENSDEEGGMLTLSDDGDGMSREELVNGFMRISSTDKVHNPTSKLYKRNRAGRKGIGRFAVQRLGNKLTIISQKENLPNAVKVTVNWDDYVGDKDLSIINNQIEELPKQKEKGTDLIIEGLRDKWTIASIERVYRYVSALIQPFPLSKERIKKEDDRNKKTLDPGFKASLFKIEEDKKIPIADEQSMIYDYAIAIFEGYVDKDGKSYVSIESKRLGISELVELGAKKDESKLAYQHLRNVNFKAYYFLYITDYIPSQQLRKIIDLAQHSGGIRLYRNGFRVLPYGDFGDDWLELDESEKKRILLPRHGNTNFFGFAEVEDPEGVKFEETSSREGLLETESFMELRDFLYRGLTTGVIKIANARAVKITTGQKDWEKKYERPVEKLKNLKEELKKEAKHEEIDNYRGKSKEDITSELISRTEKIQNVVEAIDEVIIQQEKEDEDQFKETAILRVLASLGLSIGIYTHEIRHYLATIHASTKLLSKRYPDDKDYQNKIQQLLNNVKILRTYTSYFDKTVSENISRELVPQEVPIVIERFFNVVSLDSGLNETEILPIEIGAGDLYSVPMHSSEWATILYNLYSNSLKAIKRAGNEGKILMRIGEEDGRIFLEFIDNGDGIPEENRERIFQAFYTTSTAASHFATEEDEVLGTGLGLKIVRDIIEAYNGEIEVMDAPKGFSTCIRIELPKASDKDMEKL